MAHFAELDANNVVVRVVVVANADTQDAQGNEVESIGAAFCANLLGGRWVQTSYNATRRKNYAGVGFTYNAEIDGFVPPQPFPSWLLEPATGQWVPPKPQPTDRPTQWDEETQEWVTVAPPAR